MRIAFCGKGGSGKSTSASLLARYLDFMQQDVFVVDGDINQHLGQALGFSNEQLATQPKLGMDSVPLLTYLRGDNPRILSIDHMTESTPAGNGSGFIHLKSSNPILDYYQITQNHIHFMAVGSHDDHDVGATCFHKFTGVFGLLLNHIVDNDDDLLIGDMCAGADPFASSGLASRFDAVFLIVEPTLKSISVYDQCRHYAGAHGTKIFVIGNKIESADDIDFIQSHIGVDFLAYFEKSSYIRNLEKGIIAPIMDLEAHNLKTLQIILDTAKTCRRDWGEYQSIGLKFHRQACESWANSLYGTDLMDQYDPDFSYEQVA
jgi:CO dehydrogenase maturation factor